MRSGCVLVSLTVMFLLDSTHAPSAPQVHGEQTPVQAVHLVLVFVVLLATVVSQRGGNDAVNEAVFQCFNKAYQTAYDLACDVEKGPACIGGRGAIVSFSPALRPFRTCPLHSPPATLRAYLA